MTDNMTNINNSICYHPEIKEKLNFFLTTGKIPNIIFHGASGSGKRTIVHNFISDIYGHNKELIKNYVMYVNCAHGKGIKFVRDELKFFAKTHVNIEGTGNFKIIVLSNADELTIDAQSALRRCIELFSHTTRFFIIVQDKYKLLKPILSRLCEIFVYEPIIKGKRVNLHKHNLNKTFNAIIPDKKMIWFDKKINLIKSQIDEKNKKNQHGENEICENEICENEICENEICENEICENEICENDIYEQLMDLSNKLYEKGYSGLDLMTYIDNNKEIDELKKYQMLLVFNKIKKDFRNEKLFMLFILNFMLLRSNDDLENISFM
jgi:DNA polymerase III delta prime subunit